MLNPRLFAAVFVVAAFAVQGLAQTTVQGEPFGYVKINIAAGTGSVKRTTLLSIPLLDESSITGKASGRITGLTATTITAEGAGWQPGQLSTAATPHLIEITSGEAQGRTLLLSTSAANTGDSVTLAPLEVSRVSDLRTLNINVGVDTYRIRPVDTLSSFFGTPETTPGLQGGTAPANADTITLIVNGVSTQHFFDTNLGRWTAVGSGSDSSHLPIPPFAGLQYARLGNTPLSFVVTGKVPSGQRGASIKNSGLSILSPYWPVSQTLGQLGLQDIQGWQTGSSVNVADRIVVTTTAGTPVNYFHNGENWVTVGSGANANATTVPVGASILINKRGNAGGYATYEHSAPYNLQ